MNQHPANTACLPDEYCATHEGSDLFAKLDKMFTARSIALVGASETPSKWGNFILLSILAGGYEGAIYPVNPKADTIFDLPVYHSVSELPDNVDLAIFTVPARHVPAGLRECAARGIQAAVVISAGFKEAGEEELEREIIRIAHETGLMYIGPNTMGIASFYNKFESFPLACGSPSGGLAIISQSGNLGLQILRWAGNKKVGMSYYAGTGNEAVLDANHMLAYFGSRPEVKAIAMYIEGIDNGRDFVATAREVTRHKPVIALKTGRSKTGSKAAQSHTGSMAGSFAAYNAMFRQTGITQVQTPTELLNVSAAMTHLPVPKSNRVGILTSGGGWGVIAADQCEDQGLELPSLSEEVIRDLDTVLPDFWNRDNPVDTVGQSGAVLWLRVAEALAKWDQVDAVIALGVVGHTPALARFADMLQAKSDQHMSTELLQAAVKGKATEEEYTMSELARIQQETGKPVLAVSISQELGIHHFDHGVSISLPSPEDGINVLGHLARYGSYLRNSAQ